MLVSFQMLPEQPAAELLEAATLADQLGYHACYSADEIYHKDAWLLFAALAQRDRAASTRAVRRPDLHARPDVRCPTRSHP